MKLRLHHDNPARNTDIEFKFSEDLEFTLSLMGVTVIIVTVTGSFMVNSTSVNESPIELDTDVLKFFITHYKDDLLKIYKEIYTHIPEDVKQNNEWLCDFQEKHLIDEIGECVK